MDLFPKWVVATPELKWCLSGLVFSGFLTYSVSPMFCFVVLPFFTGVGWNLQKSYWSYTEELRKKRLSQKE